MPRVELKLKQASAVLGVPQKALQNFVQAGVLKPRHRLGLYYFDTSLGLVPVTGPSLPSKFAVKVAAVRCPGVRCGRSQHHPGHPLRGHHPCRVAESPGAS